MVELSASIDTSQVYCFVSLRDEVDSMCNLETALENGGFGPNVSLFPELNINVEVPREQLAKLLDVVDDGGWNQVDYVVVYSDTEEALVREYAPMWVSIERNDK